MAFIRFIRRAFRLRDPSPPPEDPPEEFEEVEWLSRSHCTVEWNHGNRSQVGSASVITIKFVGEDGSPYKLGHSDVFSSHVTPIGRTNNREIPHVVEPTSLEGHSTIKVSFTARVSGQYRIVISLNGRPIGSGEVVRDYVPGDVDPNKTVILDKTAVLVVTEGVYTPMKIIPKDFYGNNVRINECDAAVEIRKGGFSGEEVFHDLNVFENDYGRYDLLIKLDREGHYVGWIKYQGVRIGPPKFDIICLSEKNMQLVEKNLRMSNLNIWYEGATSGKKSKKVFCFISPRQIKVKEYFFKVIPQTLSTWKVSPATQITFHPEPDCFTLADGFQEPLTLVFPDREIMAATFYKFVLKNIGGSEKFQNKREFFYSKLREHHRQDRSELKVVVNRRKLLESARQAMERFSPKDWRRKFSITFQGEEGLDYGGVSREFFEKICTELFDGANNLFMRFDRHNHQALVHPNCACNRSSIHKLNHFTFAGKIVGKCLYESCLGNTLLVKARFTRSFLAQLIGLKINYKYFESDDPDLYTTKIQYILENDVTDLELVFAEEEFDANQGSPTVVNLVKNGHKKEVTEQNKLHYLNALAHYKLTERVKEEIMHFIKGLNEIVPDTLLSIFDENELELLICGMDTVGFSDLKAHTQVSGYSWQFRQVLSWFWVVVSEFTQEEMAKLLQFVTGCSQLPPGGFKELNPPFTITSAPTIGLLPTSHTCFNQLCLPEYSSCEQFQTSLMTALNEGGEGFGIA